MGGVFIGAFFLYRFRFILFASIIADNATCFIMCNLKSVAILEKPSLKVLLDGTRERLR